MQKQNPSEFVISGYTGFFCDKMKFIVAVGQALPDRYHSRCKSFILYLSPKLHQLIS